MSSLFSLVVSVFAVCSNSSTFREIMSLNQSDWSQPELFPVYTERVGAVLVCSVQIQKKKICGRVWQPWDFLKTEDMKILVSELGQLLYHRTVPSSQLSFVVKNILHKWWGVGDGDSVCCDTISGILKIWVQLPPNLLSRGVWILRVPLRCGMLTLASA